LLFRGKKIRSCFFKADKSKNGEWCIGFSFRLRSTSYDGTRQPNILKRPLAQTITIRGNHAGFVVKINYYAGIAISDQFEHSSPLGLRSDFLKAGLKVKYF